MSSASVLKPDEWPDTSHLITEDDKHARTGTSFYSIYDPTRQLSSRPLRAFKLSGGTYVEYLDATQFHELGLRLTIWHGTYDGFEADYLRFCDQGGRLMPTKGELVIQEKARADGESARAERLAARLRALGADED